MSTISIEDSKSVKFREIDYILHFVTFSYRHDLIDVLQNYTEYMKQFKEEIARDLTFNLREGSDHDAEVRTYLSTFDLLPFKIKGILQS